MKTNLQASKSILAKLLASENITVSHQSVKTAYFDLKNRTMVLPVWKDMDGDLYDLLTGHEVGHALNTPQQGWHDEVKNSEDNKKFKDFLNVIEDARIEKLVKRKFPGLSKSFARAYASLYERDFFGIKKLEDLNTLNLIDRINLRFKMGSHVIVEFNDFEREIVREVEAVETWDQVVDIARRVYDYTKQNEQNKVQNQQDLQEQMRNERQENQEDSGEYDDADDDSDFEDDIDGNDDSDLDEESDGTDSEDSQDQTESDEDDSDDNQYSSGGDTPEEDDDEPQSVTDRNFRQREQELVNETGKIFMYKLPDVVLENIILPNTEVVNDLEKFFREQVADPNRTYGRHGISYDTVVQKCVRKFNTNNKKVIMHILKEFEMRKKASEYARTQTARTGELNMNVLHKYRFSNDLFKKITVVPKGKNHGFVMFVDMSGSMGDIMRNTIEQMLVLASFCKLAKVPFEVYGFSDDCYGNSKLREMVNKDRFVSNRAVDMTMSSSWFHLKHLIGSSLSPVQYRRAFNAMCVVANEYGRCYGYGYMPQTNQDEDHGGWSYSWDSSGFGLNGTPFLETLLASRGIITAFQNKHQLDVCNVVYLTDGDGGNNLSYPPMSSDSGFYDDRRKSVVYLIDKKTKKKVKLPNFHDMQSAITELVADVTGCKHIGFYVGNKKGIQRDMKYFVADKSHVEQDAAKKTFREHNYFVVERLGYDKYFYVGLPSTNIVDEELAITSNMNKNKMAREFSKTVGSKKSNRLLLTKLAEELAVA
jgi:cobalamin biosynthesis protein CobT